MLSFSLCAVADPSGVVPMQPLDAFLQGIDCYVMHVCCLLPFVLLCVLLRRFGPALLAALRPL